MDMYVCSLINDKHAAYISVFICVQIMWLIFGADGGSLGRHFWAVWVSPQYLIIKLWVVSSWGGGVVRPKRKVRQIYFHPKLSDLLHDHIPVLISSGLPQTNKFRRQPYSYHCNSFYYFKLITNVRAGGFQHAESKFAIRFTLKPLQA